MGRLTNKQFSRLNDILEYMQAPREELGWGGFRIERRYLSNSQWQYKLKTMLYTTYNDLYPKERIGRQAIVDYFDDEYINELTSFCKRFKKFFTKCFSFKKSEEESMLISKH